MAPRPLALLLTLWAAGTAPAPLLKGCEQELNKIKDRLQVSCVDRGLQSPPSGLPPDTGILLLSGNRLERLSLSAFGALRNLTELDVANNSLAALQPDTLLPALQQLSLARNALQNLPDLRGLPALRRLVLARNALTGLPGGGFRALPALHDLELQGNLLRSLSPAAFAGLAQLRDLDLSDNQLEALPPALLEGLEALEILRLERNRLRRVPDGFFQEHLFAYIYLRENPWSCDCRLRYLRDWISDNDMSVYTRQRGPQKETTEHDPEGVTCSAPPEQKGRPVMYFQASCRALGDGGEVADEEDPTTASSPEPTTAYEEDPTTTFSPAPTTAYEEDPTTASSPAPTTAHEDLPTASSPAPTMAHEDPTTEPTTADEEDPTIASSPELTTAHEDPTIASSPAPTTAHKDPTTKPTMVDKEDPITASSPVPTTADEEDPTTTSSPAPTTTRAGLSPAVRMTPNITASSTALRDSPSLSPPRCLCPEVPVRALQAPTARWSPASQAVLLSALCCPLRLALYVASLVLAGLPVLFGVCCRAWAGQSGHLPIPSRGLQRGSTCGAGRRSSSGVLGPLAVQRLYYVCREFQLTPARHVSWLLVSLPGQRHSSPVALSPSGPGGAEACVL